MAAITKQIKKQVKAYREGGGKYHMRDARLASGALPKDLPGQHRRRILRKRAK